MDFEKYKSSSEQRLRQAKLEQVRAEAKVLKLQRIVDNIDLSYREYERGLRKRGKAPQKPVVLPMKTEPQKQEAPVKAIEKPQETPMKTTENKPQGLFSKILNDIAEN